MLERLFAEIPILKESYEARLQFNHIFHTAPDPATAERQLAELCAETLDCLLIHRVRDGVRPRDLRPVMDVLSAAKDQGRIRAMGVFCHGGEPLAASVGVDWIDLHLTTINPFGTHIDAPPEHTAGLLKQVREPGKGVMAMKLFGGGQNAAAEERRKSLQWILGLGCIDSLSIGMTSPEEIDDVLDQIEAVTTRLLQ